MPKNAPDTIPCSISKETTEKVNQYAKALRDSAHAIGSHNLDIHVFWDSGIFRGAIERLRGEQAATMKGKRAFVEDVLLWLKRENLIEGWSIAGGKERHDYEVFLKTGRLCAIEAKGCLDGNNTNIFERPANADEFVIWSLCQNPMADPRKNAWSGIHTRLSAEIVHRRTLVDGLIIWDPVCNTVGRPCPKVGTASGRTTKVGNRNLPPPCIYLFPRTVPDVRNNPTPKPHELEEVQFLAILHKAFQGIEQELTSVKITAAMHGNSVARSTTLLRDGRAVKTSKLSPIKRAKS